MNYCNYNEHFSMKNNFVSKNAKKVIIGMSGGVDSSVSAYLLKKQGYNVEGLFMKNWEEDDTSQYCSAEKDFLDAQTVCNTLGITLHITNFSAEYWDNVFKKFISEYKAGRTPNPDVLCNKEIKFKTFLEFSIQHLNAQYIATGHYVRRANINGRMQLLRGLDKNKDQSYFLHTLNYKQIQKSLFPLGVLKKSQVRNIAKYLKLITANKKDSTGICFIGASKFRKFLSRFLPPKPGRIISVDGDEIGKHQGVMYYTIGQRRGLGIGGIRKKSNDPWYVVDKNVKKNILIVAQRYDNPNLMSIGLIANHVHWIDSNLFINNTMHFSYTVKTRYHQKDVPCTILILSEDRIRVLFKYPVSAVTPGQYAVFYSNEICLGGGIIESSLKRYLS